MKKLLIITTVCLIPLYGCRHLFGDIEQPDTIIQSTQTPPQLTVVSPVYGSIWNPGDTIDIKWALSNGITQVDIQLYKKSTFQFTIQNYLDNDEMFEWVIPASINISNHYIIKILNYNNPDEFAFSGMFGIQY